MLGGDHDQGRIVEALFLQFADECSDRGIDELEFAQQRRGGRARGIQISARGAVAAFNQLLAHAHGLEVHAEDGGNLGLLGAEVVLAVDLVEDRVDLQGVVALDVLEAVGPGGQVRSGIEDCGAGYAGGRGDAGKADHVGVDFRRVEVVERDRAEARGDRRVRRVLVGPCRVSASLVNDAEDAVGADEIATAKPARSPCWDRGSVSGDRWRRCRRR